MNLSQLKPQSTAEKYKIKFNLQPHPEGGYFAETYKAADLVKPLEARYTGENRQTGSLIYFMLEGKNYSTWHKLRSDEFWFYCDGSPIKVHIIDPQGGFVTQILGNPLNYKDAAFQVIIPNGFWFAAELIDKRSDSFCLISCAVQPAFEHTDFVLANTNDTDTLIDKYPQHSDIIKRLAPIKCNADILTESNGHFC